MSESKKPSKPQNREIRAVYDDTTITVYQAYNSAIANAAVENQSLDASPLFRPTRMTWIKPSWCWMLYRAGYSYKDANQSNILAIKIRREYFESMLMDSVVTADEPTKRGQDQIRVQWDPERNHRIGVPDFSIRSIQIGIPAKPSADLVRNGIAEIKDVTDMARELKKTLEADPDISVEELRQMGLMPNETIYPVPEELARVLELSDIVRV